MDETTLRRIQELESENRELKNDCQNANIWTYKRNPYPKMKNFLSIWIILR